MALHVAATQRNLSATGSRLPVVLRTVRGDPIAYARAAVQRFEISRLRRAASPTLAHSALIPGVPGERCTDVWNCLRKRKATLHLFKRRLLRRATRTANKIKALMRAFDIQRIDSPPTEDGLFQQTEQSQSKVYTLSPEWGHIIPKVQQYECRNVIKSHFQNRMARTAPPRASRQNGDDW
eukprot:2946208-Rhodomonas_salina.1